MALLHNQFQQAVHLLAVVHAGTIPALQRAERAVWCRHGIQQNNLPALSLAFPSALKGFYCFLLDGDDIACTCNIPHKVAINLNSRLFQLFGKLVHQRPRISVRSQAALFPYLAKNTCKQLAGAGFDFIQKVLRFLYVLLAFQTDHQNLAHQGAVINVDCMAHLLHS